MKTTKKVSKKTPQQQEAIEAERNLKKALNMADGFPPPKTNEDFKFLDKWLFKDCFFYFFKENESRNNLNPRLPPRYPREKNFRENLFLPDSLPQQ